MQCSKNKKATKKIIKLENEELFPLTHYVDDRVELVKQIFASLDPKIIKSLAPKFLKKCPTEEIEELCLNELLCISKKRLLSIINSTKCPSDTESSTDSDVNSIQEHISLEEISSDDSSDHRTRKKNAPESTTKRRRANKQKELIETNDEEPKKEYTVLELLELQARARAIRSQLALEPITKIEVDSDNSSTDNIPKKTSTLEKKTTKTNSNNIDTHKSTLNNETNVTNGGTNKKRIKLKRDFLKRHKETSKEEETPKNNNESNSVQYTKSTTVKNERSPSPDVIPIILGPETFYISSSDEENKTTINEKKSVDSKTKENSIDNNNDKQPKIDQNEATTSIIPEVIKLNESNNNEKEDGEIEEENSENDVNHQNKLSECSSLKVDEGSSNINIDTENIIQLKIDEDEAINVSNDDVISLGHDELDLESRENSTDEENNSKKNSSIQSNLSDCDSKKNETKTIKSNEKYNQNIIVDLSDDSDDNRPQNNAGCKKTEENQSWNSRWLESSKVSKILATSRLGNRVRSKRKDSKKSELIQKQSNNKISLPKVFDSKYEDGSVKQYQEILDKKGKN